MAGLPTFNELACADCLQFKIYDLGEESDREYSLGISTTITLTQTDGTIKIPEMTLAKRTRNKDTVYHRKFYNPNGVMDELTTEFASWRTDQCDGEAEFTTSGSYSVSQYSLDTEIRFADLRNGTIFYRKDESNLSAGGSNDVYIGDVLAMAVFDNSESIGCKAVSTKDAVGFPITLAGNSHTVETIIKPEHETYKHDDTGSVSMNVAASDRSGLCGGLSFYCYRWGDYGVIDTSKPYDCKTGDMSELYSVENLENYFTSWEANGPRYRFLDNLDAELFATYFGSTGARTVDYVNPLVVTPVIFGSVAHDGMGNSFYSVIGADAQKHNRIVMQNKSEYSPEELLKTDKMTPTTFYPVAPV